MGRHRRQNRRGALWVMGEEGGVKLVGLVRIDRGWKRRQVTLGWIYSGSVKDGHRCTR